MPYFEKEKDGIHFYNILYPIQGIQIIFQYELKYLKLKYQYTIYTKYQMYCTLAVTPKLRGDTFKISNDHTFLGKIFICSYNYK